MNPEPGTTTSCSSLSAFSPRMPRAATRATGRWRRRKRAIRNSIVLGERPAQDCVLAISRLGRDYVLEDGEGAVIAENHNLALIADKATALSLSARRASILARIGVVWIAVRHHYEEKIEPLFAEPMEVLTHCLPAARGVRLSRGRRAYMLRRRQLIYFVR